MTDKRYPRRMPPPIPATPEDVVQAITQGPPKRRWRYLLRRRK